MVKVKLFLLALFVLSISGCDQPKSTFDKQVDICVEDIKLGLGDPNSLEITSTKEINLDNGWFRVKVDFTAKNAMGGRVRGSSICGFENKESLVLNDEDFMNKEREISRFLNQ